MEVYTQSWWQWALSQTKKVSAWTLSKCSPIFWNQVWPSSHIVDLSNYLPPEHRSYAHEQMKNKRIYILSNITHLEDVRNIWKKLTNNFNNLLPFDLWVNKREHFNYATVVLIITFDKIYRHICIGSLSFYTERQWMCYSCFIPISCSNRQGSQICEACFSFVFIE